MNFLNKQMTECPNEDLLLDYTAGRLDAARETLFAAHAAACARCAEVRAAQTAVWRMLDEWTPAPVSEGFNRALWRKIDADAAKNSWRQSLAGFIRPVAPLAVACLLMVTAFVLDHSNRKTVITAAPAAITATDADRIEQALDDVQLLREVDVAAEKSDLDKSGVM